jgi:cytochrome b involved in lipid metabolism
MWSAITSFLFGTPEQTVQRSKPKKDVPIPFSQLLGLPYMTSSELQANRNKKYIILYGHVLDISEFLSEHPGGEEILLERLNTDATTEYEDISHTSAATEWAAKRVVAILRERPYPYDALNAKRKKSTYVDVDLITVA